MLVRHAFLYHITIDFFKSLLRLHLFHALGTLRVQFTQVESIFILRAAQCTGSKVKVVVAKL